MAQRILAQFSCGAASAVATKLALAQYTGTHEVLILNAFLKNEHADNRRFLTDCEAWFGQAVTVLRDEKFGADIIQVFRRRQFLKGPRGAPCTTTLKRELLQTVEQPGDILVLGFDATEEDRFEDFKDRWPDRLAVAPLIERGLGKDDCKAMLTRAGIELPMMYRLGYDNANCIGCVKGGAGYFRAIREDFPDQFAELAEVEAEVCDEKSYLLRHRSGPLEGQRFALKDLPPGPAVRNEGLPSCSFFCEMAEQEYAA